MRNTIFKTIIIAVFISAFAGLAYSQSETQKPQDDRPLQVKSVPQAAYTPEAKINGVYGWIKLRITFLDTGEIGDIFYVSESNGRRLTEHGLLKTSYEAAKKVKFLPAIKDGKPVTVTKVLQYNFHNERRPD